MVIFLSHENTRMDTKGILYDSILFYYSRELVNNGIHSV